MKHHDAKDLTYRSLVVFSRLGALCVLNLIPMSLSGQEAFPQESEGRCVTRPPGAADFNSFRIRSGTVKITSNVAPFIRDVTLTEESWQRGESDVTILVHGTPYALLIRNGRVQPIFVDRDTQKAWKLNGLDGPDRFVKIEAVNEIDPAEKKIQLSATQGSIYFRWTFDFSEAGALRIGFENLGGW